METVMSNKADLRKLYQFQAQGQEMTLCWPRFCSFKPRAGKNGYPESHLQGNKLSKIRSNSNGLYWRECL